MLLMLVVLVPLLAGAAAVFVNCPPKIEPQRMGEVRRFNRLVLAILAVICLFVAAGFRASLLPTQDHAWWPIVAAFGSLAIAVPCLVIAAIVRNLLVFRSRTAAKEESASNAS